ncbi:MAG: hypothetical protein L0I29_06760 [Hyphomicrobiales bacterium]|nr:hypothetical protein [Hyphomicrobiales bacterium]
MRKGRVLTAIIDKDELESNAIACEGIDACAYRLEERFDSVFLVVDGNDQSDSQYPPVQGQRPKLLDMQEWCVHGDRRSFECNIR